MLILRSAIVLVPEVDCRRRRLLEALLRLPNGAALTYDNVKGLYKSRRRPREIFRSDCKKLVELRQRAVKVFGPLVPLLPSIRFEDGQLLVSARQFANSLQPREPEELREKFVSALLEAKDGEGDFLVPRGMGGSLYLGYGTTLYFLTRTILQRGDFQGLSIYTANLEIAALFYFLAPGQFANGTSRLYLPDLAVAWDSGSMLPRPSTQRTYGVSIGSFDLLNAKGDLVVTHTENFDLTQQALEVATEKVLLIADHSKLHRAGDGTPLKLSKAKAKNVLFVCSGDPGKMFREKNPNVDVIVLDLN